eukprot:gene527-10210_t
MNLSKLLQFKPSRREKDQESGSVHVITDKETIQGPFDKHQFQAETRQLLDIVARSLYSEKEVFIREIISNSSDALEKLRHQQLVGEDISDPELPFEIHLTTDEDKHTFTIQDYGIGMEKDELIANLGTIARSGSREFVKNLQGDDSGSSATDSIIGQFGVGFYSAFMVGSKIDVYSKSCKPNSVGYFWTSDGSGSYEIAQAEGVSRGTKIIIHLKKEDTRFSIKSVVEDVVKKYSNFVGFPIFLNGSRMNAVQALWLSEERNISNEDHEKFYQFITNTSDTPRYHIVYKTDAPLNIRSLFYVPTTSPELFGFGKMENNVSLYSRKVLIQAKAENLLPGWLRFMKGVVDSEDIPLNLSRELLQDSALIKKLASVVSSKLTRFFQDQMKKDYVKYEKFFKDYGIFIREGVVSSENQQEREEIAKLLRFESSKEKPGFQKTLTQYVKDMKPDQKGIFYLCIPSRELAESSPYFEALKSDDVEVLFTYNEHDDVVLHQLKEFNKKPLTSAENYLTNAGSSTSKENEAVQDEQRLSEKESKELVKWLESTLGKEKVFNVKVSERLASHPAMITVPDMAAARRWLKFIKTGPNADLQKIRYDVLQATLEINPSHEIIKSMDALKTKDPTVASLLANQVFDNALIVAGLLDDPREMVGRLNTLLSKTLEKLNDGEKQDSAS